MLPYKNAAYSGVIAYEVGADNIITGFRDGSVYRYNYASAGRANIEKMKALATGGKGLATYINQFFKNRYAQKNTVNK